MNRFFHALTKFIFVLTVFFPAFVFVQAQNAPPPPPPPPAPREGIATRIGSMAAAADDEDEKGSIVRGRVFYQDSNTPVRRGWIGLTKIRELVEEKSDGNTIKPVVEVRTGGGNYVLTNDNGEFTIRKVKAGIYQPVFKVAGILNPTTTSLETPLYALITVDGISEISIQVAAKRGGSVSGKVQYFDGTAVIGAKVHIVGKKDVSFIRYSGDENTSDTTDDRGFYHFAGLPDGEYFVRVTEPSVHNEAGGSVQSYNISSYGNSSILTTFYPNASKTEEATAINVIAGQEQSEINISIPDRRLFRMSGLVVAKNNKTPVKNLQVSFQKVGEQSYSYYYDQSKQAKTDEQGKWAFGDLPKGKYLIKVLNNIQSAAYTPDGKPKIENQPKYATISKEIEIDNDDVADVILEMTPESAISGTVVVEGGKEFPPFVFLRVFDAKSRTEASGSVNSYGEKEKTTTDKTAKPFRISALSAGKYSFFVNTNENFYVKSARSGNIDLMTSPVEIGEGVEINDVQVVLSVDVGILRGKVNNFTPNERAFVVLLPVNKSGMDMLFGAGQGAVGKTGEFEVKAAPGEYYAVVVSESNRPKSDKIAEWLTELIADAPKITLKAKETVSTSLDSPKK